MESELYARDASNEELFQSPKLPPHIKTWRFQLIGLPLLILIPLLAMMGIFGKELETITVKGGGLVSSIEYPTKMRYGQEVFMRLELKNTTGETIKNVSVNFDENYIKRFDGVEFTPNIEENYITETGDIPAGETRLIDVKLKAGEIGNQTGKFKFFSGEKKLFSTRLKTFIFP